MSLHDVAIRILLSLTVLACWIGVLGMLRMRRPVQALHYLGFPATIGVFALVLAVFIESGFSPASLKTLLIAFVLLGINSVVTHATARAFRTRELGHWKPLDGDPLEFVPSTHHPGPEAQQ
jgi:multisubunit Na+/H+ antiporter MnhG subunit